MSRQPGVRMRADARRNRDHLIAAASAAFAESGPDVPLEEVARRAGVGIGTLYRRFPDREALLRAVAAATVATVLDHARAAVAEEPTAWLALVRLLGHARDLRMGVRLALAWPAARDDPQDGQLRAELMVLLDQLVRGAQAEGALRADVGTGDVAAMVWLLLRPVPGASDEVCDLVAQRALGLLVDGLRAAPGHPPGGSELPGRPITAQDLQPHPRQR